MGQRERRLLDEPTPVEDTPWVVAVDRTVAVLVASGVALSVVGTLFVPTLGARRGTRLKWAERAAEIEAAVSAADKEPR